MDFISKILICNADDAEPRIMKSHQMFSIGFEFLHVKVYKSGNSKFLKNFEIKQRKLGQSWKNSKTQKIQKKNYMYQQIECM